MSTTPTPAPQSAPVSPAAPSRVSAERIEAALGNPTPCPVPERIESRAFAHGRIGLTIKGTCAVRYPNLTRVVIVDVGSDGLLQLQFNPEEAEAFAAALIEHAKYTRAGTAWVDAKAGK